MAQDLARMYQLLEVTPTCSAEAIKAAFRRQAKRHHPDRNPDDPSAAARFAEVKAACEALLRLSAAFRAKAGPGPESPAAPDGGPSPAWKLTGVERDGLNVTYWLEVPPIAGGGELVIPLRRDRVCPDCRGRGWIGNWSWRTLSYLKATCPRCQGRGLVEQVKSLRVNLPAWLKPDCRLRLGGCGRLHPQTGRRGDLFLNLSPVKAA